MSSRRETNDGTFITGSFGIAEWGNSGFGEVKTTKHASAKRTREYAASKRVRKKIKVDAFEESPFSEGGEKDRYLITYADLITLLLGLFILLYTASNLDAQKYEKMVNAIGNVFGGTTQTIKVIPDSEIPITPPLGNLKSDINSLIEKNNYTSSIKLEENSRGVTIHILEDIVFPSGSAELKKSSKIVLQQLAAIIKKLPNDIRIEGHTDNVPISTAQFPSNWHLSVSRALSTAYYLMTEQGLDPEKLSIVGFSEYKPLDSNENLSGRATNRRVDIIIIK
jgi:chemotaxis protein MotB